MVLNDEAHHCYQDKPLPAGEKLDKEEKDANERPGSGSGACRRSRSTSASSRSSTCRRRRSTLEGSGYNEGFIFPWAVSDFSLMDAIESGIVKVPRTPVDDDAADELVTYLRLWDFVGDELPKRAAKDTGRPDWIPPPGARGRAAQPVPQLRARRFEHWERTLAAARRDRRRCSSSSARTRSSASWSTTGSRASEVDDDDGEIVATSLATSSCSATSSTASRSARPRTILIDSAQLESGDGMKDDFKEAAPPRSRRSRRSTAAATPAPTSRRSPTRIFCAR